MLHKKRVLILEDSSSFQQILGRLLEDEFEFKILSEATNAI